MALNAGVQLRSLRRLVILLLLASTAACGAVDGVEPTTLSAELDRTDFVDGDVARACDLFSQWSTSVHAVSTDAESIRASLLEGAEEVSSAQSIDQVSDYQATLLARASAYDPIVEHLVEGLGVPVRLAEQDAEDTAEILAAVVQQPSGAPVEQAPEAGVPGINPLDVIVATAQAESSHAAAVARLERLCGSSP